MRVKPEYGMVWVGLGVEIGFRGNIMPADPRTREFTVELYRFLESGAVLEPNPIRKMPGGLDKIVPDGFALMNTVFIDDRKTTGRAEEYMRPVSMEKLVYSPTE